MNRRLNGFGTLVSKGKGKPWLAKWVYKGQTYYKTTGEIDRKKALKELERLTRPYRDEREEDVIRNLQNRLLQLQECQSKSKLIVEAIWLEFEKKLKTEDVESATTRIYESGVKQMAEWMKLRVKFAKDINSTLASQYLEHLSGSVGVATYNTRLVLFKRVWKSLNAEFQLDTNAWESFKKKKAVKSSRRTLSNKELAKILATAETHDLQLLFTIGIYTGLRISDCALLKWESVDMEKKVLRVVPIKTRKHMDAPIEIPMHQALVKMIEETPHEGEYVSKANADAYMSGYIGVLVANVLKKCGIETSKKVEGKTKFVCGFHSLRHTFVSMAINSGMSPLLVQKIVGHSAVNMTEHYFHENIDKMAEGICAMPDVAQLCEE